MKPKISRPIQRRALLVLAVLVTLTALFYLEEDWRGKRAWDQCKAGLEASGIPMDWNKYIPPAIPDDQNFYTASTNILQRFKKAQNDAEFKLATNNPRWPLMNYDTLPMFTATKTNPLLVASITVSSSSPLNHDADLFIKAAQPDLAEQVQGLLQKHLGRSAVGSAGFIFSEFSLSNLAPARIVLNTETTPSLTDLAGVIPVNLDTNLGHLLTEATGDGRFRVLLVDSKVTSAAEYLRWNDKYTPALDEVREALKRPYAIIPGDYSKPYESPIPNFIALRFIAQTLTQRAQCDFLLDRPDQALRELTLTRDLCRILEKPPTGQPETLVEAMINVAITGLYADTIAEGLRRHAWQEPQLAALQDQLSTIHLPGAVYKAFKMEIVASSYQLQISTPADLQKMNQVETRGSRRPAQNLWNKAKSGYWLLYLVPRGWFYQNMVVAAQLAPERLATFDLTNDLVHPASAEHSFAAAEAAVRHWSLWNRWACISVPNFAKAMQRTSFNQTLVNEAQIACALERYHLDRHEYPATLAELVPQYIAVLPHDLIGGAPLHYRRTDNGKFRLYSIGWNEKDDNGQPSALSDVKQGDWVWKN